MGIFGNGVLFASGGNPAVVCCFTSAGTWNCPTGASKVVVIGIGGGGGGGAGIVPNSSSTCCLATGAGGGGGGGVTCCVLTGVAIPSSACVTVGNGGNRGTTNGQNGSNGGSSIFCYGGSAITAGGGAGGEGGCSSGFINNTVYTSEGGNGGSGNYLCGGKGGNGHAFYCTSPVSVDVNGRQGTFPSGNGGRGGGGGGGFRCPTTDGSPGPGTDDSEFVIEGQIFLLGSSGEGADYADSCAANGTGFGAGGGGGASPGNYLRSCGGNGSPGFVLVKSYF
jgi:hypothetical protein